jgi:hypothetical protein
MRSPPAATSSREEPRSRPLDNGPLLQRFSICTCRREVASVVRARRSVRGEDAVLRDRRSRCQRARADLVVAASLSLTTLRNGIRYQWFAIIATHCQRGCSVVRVGERDAVECAAAGSSSRRSVATFGVRTDWKEPQRVPSPKTRLVGGVWAAWSYVCAWRGAFTMASRVLSMI